MAKVLLVADAPWAINDVRAALSDTRYDLVLVTDPREAAEARLEEAPDVVVVDLQVGSMGGFAVVRDLRDATAAAGEPLVPTVLLLDRTVDTFLAGRSGADAWLLKPVSSFELRSVVDELATTPAADPA
jgi:DNA-binding response OmpR family regulator